MSFYVSLIISLSRPQGMARQALVWLAGAVTCLALVVTSSFAPQDKMAAFPPSPPHPTDTPHAHRQGPRVDQGHSGNVSSVLGGRASLRCRVLNRGNHTVSWIRHRDLHLLTVDHYTYTTDQRFQALHEPSTGDWVLLVGWVQQRDAGVYECQIGTTPPTSHFVTLGVMEPRTIILGGGDLHVNTGSTINLTCLVLHHARPPDAITWVHQGKEVHYASARGGVSVVTEAGEVSRSALLVQRATLTDAGNYTCQPKGAASATARVHVIHGEHRAAMHGNVGDGGFLANTRLVTWAALSSLWWAWAAHEPLWRPPSPPLILLLLLASLLLPGALTPHSLPAAAHLPSA
ncbi:zwei Ig domain protein zig-8-like [Eriocheir sinensis]|uniref:zwei Ig domain protein zig-8-like n=1 Tax=Eriocheir sinensis TaxID=95602 RepID=UPI0021C59094|nr:zwei Ig domain protein zig-8-like [Eriocheir sinensis]